MKNLNCKMSKLLFMSIISVLMSLFVIPVSADQVDTSIDSSGLVFVPTSYSGKPPFHRHVTKQKFSEIKKITDDSPVYLKWKPPFSRHQLKQDRLEHAQLAKLEKTSGNSFKQAADVNKHLIGSRPPFNRN